jgi:hypothetical protein
VAAAARLAGAVAAADGTDEHLSSNAAGDDGAPLKRRRSSPMSMERSIEGLVQRIMSSASAMRCVAACSHRRRARRQRARFGGAGALVHVSASCIASRRRLAATPSPGAPSPATPASAEGHARVESGIGAHADAPSGDPSLGARLGRIESILANLLVEVNEARGGIRTLDAAQHGLDCRLTELQALTQQQHRALAALAADDATSSRDAALE